MALRCSKRVMGTIRHLPAVLAPNRTTPLVPPVLLKSTATPPHLPLTLGLLLLTSLSAHEIASHYSHLEAENPSLQELRHYIDHTLLKPEASPKDIVKLVDEAVAHGFMAVCVNPVYVKLAKSLIRRKSAPVKVCCVVGFPLGATGLKGKEVETQLALEEGADEIDMVICVGKLKAGLHEEVKEEIIRVVRLCKRWGATSKVIIETCLLTNDEKATACRLAMEAGADFVKTSTGFSTGGATEEDIRLMKRLVKPYKGSVKASGGVRTREDALRMIKAGASRIGTSSGVAICTSGGGTSSAVGKGTY